MRVAIALALIALVGCGSFPRQLHDPHEEMYEEHPVSAVDAVAPAALSSLGLDVVVHHFDGGVGYLRAVSPSGAQVEVRYEWVMPELSFIRVVCTRPYGDQVSSRVAFTISKALNEPG